MYTQDFSENCSEKVDKTQDIYLSAYRKKRQIIAYLSMLQDREIAQECGIDYTHFREVFGNGRRFENLTKRLHDCGSYLTFRWYHKKDETKLHHANFCKADKLCPACAVRRAYKQQKKFLKAWHTTPDLRDKKWYYIVIPVPHHRNETIDQVYAKIDKIRKAITKSIRDAKSGKKAGIWGLFDGGMGSIEVTKTRNGWNVHLNLLICTDHDIEIKPIKNRRGQISYQNPQIVEFLKHQVDGKMHNIEQIDTSSEEALRSNLVEVLKYSLKFSSLSTMDLVHVYMAFYRKRLFFTFGDLWGLKLEDVQLEGDEIVDDEFIEIIYRRVSERYELESSKLQKIEPRETLTVAETPKRSIDRPKRKPIEVIILDRFGLVQRRYWDYSQVSDFAIFAKTMSHSPAPPPREKG